MKKFTFLFFAVFSLSVLLSLNAGAQKFFTDAGENKTIPTNGVRVITPQKYRASALDIRGLKNYIWALPSENVVNRNQAPILELPMPDGKMAKFHVWESSIMEPGLSAKFPEIKTFAGQGIDDPYATIRFDYNPYSGFHAQVLSINGNVYIDPYAKNDINNYISYFTQDNHRNPPLICEMPENPGYAARVESGPCRGTQLYSYRLALACTGEYAVAVNGPTPTVAGTLAAMTTSVNRVDGVYELELSIRFILIANTNLLIYLDGTTDPYTNNNGGTMLGQNQTNIDAIIGTANYDFGHVFSTGGGGIAGLGVICSPTNKARGVTGLPNPVGDDFDIDFVAHEMGHQFGANHPFNSSTGNCGGGNRNASTAYEVGSGTTIMAYAGICGSDDIQPHSDPFFHTISFDEISNYIEAGGAACKVATNTGNTLPVITAMNNNGANIPLNTPFTLTGAATDANGDALTYCWEEWDLGPSTTWNGGNANTTSPLFKPRIPKTSGSRTFPDMAVILAGYPANPPGVMGGLKGETLPTQARALKFRLTVRDNRAGGGGMVTGGEGCQAGFTSTFQVNTIASTGPFVVSIPNGGENWASSSSQTITWSVAGTNAAPISCANVKISLSTDGGLTYPTVLTASTPNDGSEVLTMPNVNTTTARIKIEAVGNIFFDISNANFTIGGAPPPPGADAQISAILVPANGSSISCPAVIPVVTIKNVGVNNLTSATINVRLDGGGPVTQSWSGNLVQGASENVTLNLTPLNVAAIGSHTVKIHTTLPNGAADTAPANDTATSVFSKIAPVALPVSHNFETVFLPPGWTLTNPDGDITWGWFTPGAGGAGNATAIDDYDYDAIGQFDDITTTTILTTGLLANDSVLITFDLAHKNFPDPTLLDSLKVMVSNDCGTTWTTVWQKGDPELATAGSSSTIYATPAAADWKTQRASIGTNLFGAGQIQVKFRNITGFGNVVWLDNINISMKPRKDMQTTAIVRPNPTECAPPFVPSITVKNNGGETVTGFKTGYILNNGTPVMQVHNISLVSGASTTITFPSLNPPAGNNTIKMFVADPITLSPGPDGTPGNDTLTRVFAVPVTVPSVIQGFEGTTFIPANWVLLNPNNNATWARTSPAGKGKASDFAAFFDNYNNNVVNQLDIMQAPPVNTVGADSVIISFDVAHKDYPGSFDRLRVLVSTNCGTSFTSVYSNSGPALATAGESDADYTNPLQSDWRNDVIRLGNTSPGNIIVQFENRNDFGNNIYVDNINVVPKFKRDIEVLSVSPDVACSTSGYIPIARVHNRGTEAVTKFDIAYTIGAGTPVTQTVSSINLAPDATMNITLAAGTLTAGANNIRVYTSGPVTASGTGDQYTLNDSLTKVSYATGLVQAPASVVETFEGGFIPAGWAIANADNALTWQKAGIGKSSTGSAYLRNYAYYSSGQKDLLYSPVLGFTGVDSIKLSFDLSATTRDYPGSTTIGMDTLEVLVTKDCGNTFTSVYKKWGSQLQTIGDANYPQPTEFTPNGPFVWRTETINLTSFAPNGPLQVVFRNTTNNQNDVYIDNVNFGTVTLPSILKTEGVIVTPNPFSEQFNLWFIQTPSDLRYITVLNSAGQLVWKKEYGNGSNTNVINVNMSGMAAGVYLLNLGYSDKSKEKQIKIIKSN